jgi:hypothetical protein
MPDIRSFDLVTAVIIEPDSAEATRVLLVSMAGIAIHAEIRRIRSYSGVLMETEESGYRQTLWANPLKHQLGRIGLSPVAEKFRYIVSNSPRLLLQ